MSSIIPAEQILKGTNAQEIIELFGDSLASSYISSYLEKLIPESNISRLSKYDSESLETDLNDNNLKKEIERLNITQKKVVDLANLKSEYSKFSKDILIQNRFEKIQPKTIIGVGVDGSGYHPLNYTQENNDVRKIENEAQIQIKWNPVADDGEDYLRESVKNVCFWQASNVAQFPIGTPVEVCSAIIELLSPVKEQQNDYTNTELNNNPFNGKSFIDKRQEIKGLQYFINGNLFDIDDININGKKDFEKQNFIRFGLNGFSSNIKILLKNTISTFLPFICNEPLNNKIVNNELYQILVKINNSYLNNPSDQRAVILFLFTIFFEYGCYIFNIYYEYLIKKIDKSYKELIEYYKRANILMFYNYILLINYSLIRKFEIKNNNDEYYDPTDFIYVDESSDDLPNNLIYNNKKVINTKVARRIFPNEIKLDKEKKNNIKIYFKEELYSVWNVNSSEFTLEKFPISFNTNMDLTKPSTDIYDVDYVRTIEKLTSFLLQDNNGEIPKIGEEQVITVGAPFQNEEVFKQTFEALDAYYDFIRLSKNIYVNYAQTKIEIFQSSYTAKDIQKWYNIFMDRFRIIFTSYSTKPDMQKTEVLKIIEYILSEYKKLRSSELKYLVNTTSLKKNFSNSSQERIRAIFGVKYGLAAEMIIKIAELTFLIYQSKNPGTPSIFVTDLYEIKKNIDKELSEKTKKILESQQALIYRKLGKNKNIKISNQTVSLNNLPPTPAQFTSIFKTLLSQYGFSIKGISSQNFGGKNILPNNLRIKVENIKFWQDLRKLFKGYTILVPVAKTKNNKFNDNDFYLVDIIKSILFNKLKIFKITQNGIINRKLVDSVILNNSYIMIATNEIDLANPVSWRCINYNNFKKLLKSDGTFKNIKATSGAFFNLIANNSVLTNLMTVPIPPNSNITFGLIKYCNSIMKKNLVECTILMCRNQFAKTVQSQMGTLPGTSGIDLLNGLSYYKKNSIVRKTTGNILVR